MRTDLAKAFYNAAAVTERNDPDSAASAFAVDRMRSQLEAIVKPGMLALDLGCGAGRFTFAMESLGAVATGVDCAAVPLEHARRLASQWQSKSCFHQCEALLLPFEESTFDLALLADNIVEFSPADVDLMSAEVARVLVDGGWFCLSLKEDEAPQELMVSRYTVPEHGEFEYHSYPWTAERARTAIGKHLAFVREESLEEGRRWLVFRKD